MNKNTKIKGIKRAIGDYKWCECYDLSHRFYFDLNTREVWCNLYNDCNSWTEYYDKNIIEIYPYEYLGDEEKITMVTLRYVCECYLKAYDRI